MMIPSDIITQILHLLPSKTIARFRCVSKGWLSLLTNPKFIKTHQETLKRNHLIFRDNHNEFLYSHPFYHHDSFIFKPTKLPIESMERYYITFRGSCDGLVLVSHNGDTPVLFNPTTREFVQLSQSSGYYSHPRYQKGVQIYNTHGIGYDSVTDDYKVITFTYFEYYIDDDSNCDRPTHVTSTTTRVSIYSLRSNTWRQLLIDSPYEFRYTSHAVYVNGFFHWIGMKKDTDCSKVIVAFSLVDECFREVPSPNYCNDTEIMTEWNNPKLIVLGGKLAIYVSSEGKWWPRSFEVWMMNEYGVKESWIKIPLDIFDDEFHMVKSMIFDDNGKIRVANKGQMFIYDFEKRTFSKNVYIWSFHKFRLMGS